MRSFPRQAEPSSNNNSISSARLEFPNQSVSDEKGQSSESIKRPLDSNEDGMEILDQPRLKQQKLEQTTSTHQGSLPSSTQEYPQTSATISEFTQPDDLVHKSVHGGAPVRRYLNQQLTPYLLEGVKMIAREQPEDPLEKLAFFLLEKSKSLKAVQ
ncbi:uncharacterized protein V1516DRAFT_678030 [Lipomyces oligophaga]|uniref:uncharacterized protein n=1 Tax=Lipomyces oligophaga TaxID=45792 RepID=UPI0034CF03BA